jgi:hypothetical protein
VLCVETAKGDVISRIHHHRDDVVLANPHERGKDLSEQLVKWQLIEDLGRFR